MTSKGVILKCLTGQKWTLTMVRLMMLAKDLEEGKEVTTADVMPDISFIETENLDGTCGADIFNSLRSPRYMKTHLPF